MLSSPSALADRTLATSQSGRTDWLGSVTYAHRGLHAEGAQDKRAVENSPTAFAAAIARGLGIECDVQETADGQAVVFHDFTLDRLTDRKGPVRDLTLAEACAIPLKGGRGDCIPSLGAVLAQIGGQVPLLIEVKTHRQWPVDPLCAAVRDALDGYRGNVAVMSFDARVVRWFATHAPAVVRGLVVSEQDARGLTGSIARHWALFTAKPEFLACDARDLPSRFTDAQRRSGRPVLTWTVRDPHTRERVLRHVDALIAEGAGLP